MQVLDDLATRARRLKRETHALAIAYADPRTPPGARLVVAAVIAYALSPVDLIPDFVPVLGYLDDVILIPLGIALALRLIPAEVMADARDKASDPEVERRLGRTGAVLIGALWLAVVAVAVIWLARLLR